MSDSELTRILQERMATKYGVKDETPATPAPETKETEVVAEVATETPAQEVTPEADAPVVETPATPVSSPLKDALAKANITVDQYSDDELGSQLANVIAERDAQRRQMQEMQQQIEQMRQAQQQYAPPQPAQPAPAPTKPESDAQKLSRWQKVEVNQELVKYCEYDDKTSKFLPDPKYGADGVAAAKQLNDAVAEQQRRSQLMVNDLSSALKEAGVLDEIEQRIETRLQEYNKKLAQTLTERQEQALAQRQQLAQENEFQKFYEEHKSEFFRTDANGKVMIGLDQKEVPTERGLLYSAKVREVCEELGVTQPDLRVWKLAYKLLPPKETPKTPEQIAVEKKQQAEVKKTQFVEQARKKPDSVKTALVAMSLAQPIEPTAGRKLSFREMLERDPDNAEVLGAHYKGN